MKYLRMRWVVLGAVLIVATVVMLVGLSRSQPVPGVAAVKIVRGDLNAVVTTNGKVEAVAPFVLRAQLASFVTQVAAVEGRPVHGGDLLLELDTAAARAELDRAREALLSAEDDLRSARAGGRADELAQLDSDMRKTAAELERLRTERAALERLLPKQAATQDDLNQNLAALEKTEAESKRLESRKAEMARRARLDVERAQLQAERARDEAAALEKKVSQGRLTAPFDGVLYRLPVRAGDYVQTGDLLAELADLKRVRVRAFVDEPDIGLLQPGETVEITWDALPNRSWLGRTDETPKTVVPRGTRSVAETLCSVENEKGELLPNTNVNVRIRVQERKNVLVVPRGAVRSEGTHRYVFLIEASQLGLQASRLHKREIHLGIASATAFEVLDGLSEKDEVALPGDVALADGIKVRVTTEK